MQKGGIDMKGNKRDPFGHRYDKESILWQSSLTLSYAKGICAMGSEKF